MKAEKYEIEIGNRKFQVWSAEDQSFVVIEYVAVMGGDAENGPTTEYEPEILVTGCGLVGGEQAAIDAVKDAIDR